MFCIGDTIAPITTLRPCYGSGNNNIGVGDIPGTILHSDGVGEFLGIDTKLILVGNEVFIVEDPNDDNKKVSIPLSQLGTIIGAQGPTSTEGLMLIEAQVYNGLI